MKRWQPLLLLLLAVLIALACFTVETRTRSTGPTLEALLDPWLGAARLLERRRLVVETAPDYGGLPPRTDVLVLATPLDYLDEQEREALLDWVRDGGHLVTALPEEAIAGRATERGGVLGALLDLRLREGAPDRDAPARGRPGASTPNLVVTPGGSLAVSLQARRRLAAGPGRVLWQARDHQGLVGLRRPLERGQVTVLSDLRWFENDRLGNGDHAGLFWSALDARPGARVLLVPGIERPSLLHLAWQRAAPLLVALALFVLAWLWQATRRFGPLRAGPPAARRRLAEHLEATGHYLLRQGGLARLHAASRARLLAQVQRRHPQWRSLPPAQLAAQLAARARLERGAVERVLAAPPPDHLPQFAADIRLLNRLRKAL